MRRDERFVHHHRSMLPRATGQPGDAAGVVGVGAPARHAVHELNVKCERHYVVRTDPNECASLWAEMFEGRMGNLRTTVILLSGWLGLLFTSSLFVRQSTVGAGEPALVFYLSIGAVVAILAWKSLGQVSVVSTGMALVAGYVTLRLVLAGGAVGTVLDSYVVPLEAAALTVSVMLAYRVSAALRDFESAVQNIMLPAHDPRIQSVNDAGPFISTEMERARRHGQPLTVSVYEFDRESLNVAMHRAIQEAQQVLMQSYVMNRTASLIAQKTRRTDIVVHDALHQRFIVLSPGSVPDQIEVAAERVRSSASTALGVDLSHGSAAFPLEALTFHDLVVQAAQKLDREAVVADTPSFEPAVATAGTSASPVYRSQETRDSVPAFEGASNGYPKQFIDDRASAAVMPLHSIQPSLSMREERAHGE